MTINKIYIRFIDGVNVLIPVEAKLLTKNHYEILPNNEFDYMDNTILFEFGIGDLVKCKFININNSPEATFIATELIKSGSQQNDIKRMLYDILQNNPKPKHIFENYDKSVIEYLFNDNLMKYPDLINWIEKYRSSIQLRYK